MKISRHQLEIWWWQIEFTDDANARVASKLNLPPSNLQLMPWNFQIQNCYLHCNVIMCIDVYCRIIDKKRFMKSVSWPKSGYTSITCSTISNILYNLIFTKNFNDSFILITIISCDYLNLSLADEHFDDVTIPTQVIEYNQNFLQGD